MGDEELKRALSKWEVPEPSAALDRRVFESCNPVKRVSWKLWGAIAAGLLTMLAANFFSPDRPGTAGDASRLETRLTVTGFRPIPDGAVTVVRAGAKP